MLIVTVKTLLHKTSSMLPPFRLLTLSLSIPHGKGLPLTPTMLNLPIYHTIYLTSKWWHWQHAGLKRGPLPIPIEPTQHKLTLPCFSRRQPVGCTAARLNAMNTTHCTNTHSGGNKAETSGSDLRSIFVRCFIVSVDRNVL